MSDPFRLFWPVDSRRVNQFFGANPELYKQFGLAGHEGLDLRAPTNANIYAAADGMVYFAGHPPNHPYGLLIRIKHEHQGEIYRTIYAHLQEVFVSNGQQVKAGDRIALADNTGNSFGSHLHLTLVKDGAQTPGFTPGIIDPWPYLKDSHAAKSRPLNVPPPSDLVLYTTTQLNLRSLPTTNSTVQGLLGVGEPVTVLGDAKAARRVIGLEGQWIQVQTANNLVGYVAAWFVEAQDKAEMVPSDIVVYPNIKLNIRQGPSLNTTVLDTVLEFEPLIVFGDNETVQQSIGQKNQWLHIQTEQGVRGYVAAEAVRLTGEIAARCGLTLFPTDALSMRARSTTDSNRLAVVMPDDELNVLGDIDQAYQRIGQPGEWINVEARGIVGWVAGEYTETSEAAAFGSPETVSSFSVFPKTELPLRLQAAKHSPEVVRVPAKTELLVIEGDLEAARARVGVPRNWLFVETLQGKRGWVSADEVTLEETK